MSSSGDGDDQKGILVSVSSSSSSLKQISSRINQKLNILQEYIQQLAQLSPHSSINSLIESPTPKASNNNKPQLPDPFNDPPASKHVTFDSNTTIHSPMANMNIMMIKEIQTWLEHLHEKSTEKEMNQLKLIHSIINNKQDHLLSANNTTNTNKSPLMGNSSKLKTISPASLQGPLAAHPHLPKPNNVKFLNGRWVKENPAGQSENDEDDPFEDIDDFKEPNNSNSNSSSNNNNNNDAHNNHFHNSNHNHINNTPAVNGNIEKDSNTNNNSSHRNAKPLIIKNSNNLNPIVNINNKNNNKNNKNKKDDNASNNNNGVKSLSSNVKTFGPNDPMVKEALSNPSKHIFTPNDNTSNPLTLGTIESLTSNQTGIIHLKLDKKGEEDYEEPDWGEEDENSKNFSDSKNFSPVSKSQNHSANIKPTTLFDSDENDITLTQAVINKSDTQFPDSLDNIDLDDTPGSSEDSEENQGKGQRQGLESGGVNDGDDNMNKNENVTNDGQNRHRRFPSHSNLLNLTNNNFNLNKKRASVSSALDEKSLNDLQDHVENESESAPNDWKAKLSSISNNNLYNNNQNSNRGGAQKELKEFDEEAIYLLAEQAQNAEIIHNNEFGGLSKLDTVTRRNGDGSGASAFPVTLEWCADEGSKLIDQLLNDLQTKESLLVNLKQKAKNATHPDNSKMDH